MKTFLRKNAVSVLSLLITAFILITMLPFSRVFAEEALSLSVSGNQEVGSNVTVSAVLSGSGPYSGFDGLFSYDDKLLSLSSISAGNFDAKNFQVSGSKFLVYNTTIPGGSVIVTATFSCVAEGTTDVTVQLNSLGDMNGQDISVPAASTSIAISKPVPKSSNALLSALYVSPGTLSPAFSPETFEYSVQVGSEISTITVSATAQDENARIALNGAQEKLAAGKNNVTVTVTAQDGSVRLYTILVTRSEGPTPTPTPTPKPLPLVYIDDVAYTILTAGPNDEAPEGFAATTVPYADVIIPALVRTYGEAQDSSELVLVFLTNDSRSSYFVYERQNQMFYPYIPLQMSPDSYMYAGKAPETMIPTGYEPFKLSFHDREITAYRLISAPEHLQCLIYLMNDKGVNSFYIYDQEVQLIIPYRGEVILMTPTPVPTPTTAPTLTPVPTLPVHITKTPAESVLVENPGKEEPASSSLLTTFPSLLDYKNPVVLLFYLLCLIVLVLIVLLVLFFVRKKSSTGSDEVSQKRPNTSQHPDAILFSKDARRERNQSDRRIRYTQYEDPDLEDTREIGEEEIQHPVILEPKRNHVKPSRKDIPTFEFPPVFEKNQAVQPTDKPVEPLKRPGTITNPAENKKQDPVKGLLFGDPDDE